MNLGRNPVSVFVSTLLLFGLAGGPAGAGQIVQRTLSISPLEPQPVPLSVTTDPVVQDISTTGMHDALDKYYGSERDALPATALAGAVVSALGGVLVGRKSQLSKGLGLPLLIFGGVTEVGTLAYWSQIDAKHSMYASLLNEAPERYRYQELQHLEKMQSNFARSISIDSSVAVAGLGLAVYGAVRGKSFLKGMGIGTLITAAALTGLEIHNRDRSVEYLNKLQSFESHTSLEMGEDIKSWAVNFHTSF